MIRINFDIVIFLLIFDIILLTQYYEINYIDFILNIKELMWVKWSYSLYYHQIKLIEILSNSEQDCQSLQKKLVK